MLVMIIVFRLNYWKITSNLRPYIIIFLISIKMHTYRYFRNTITCMLDMWWKSTYAINRIFFNYYWYFPKWRRWFLIIYWKSVRLDRFKVILYQITKTGILGFYQFFCLESNNIKRWLFINWWLLSIYNVLYPWFYRNVNTIFDPGLFHYLAQSKV